MNCDITMNVEMQQLEYNIDELRLKLDGMDDISEKHGKLSDKLDGMDDISEKLGKLSDKLDGMDDISEKLGKLSDKLDVIDDKLENIAEDTHVPAAYRGEYKIHHFRSPLGTYMYSHSDAVVRCQEEGMVIATPQQLQVAWQKGIDVCTCGWLSDRSNRYPIQYPRPGCGGTQAGITECRRSKADVYCFG